MKRNFVVMAFTTLILGLCCMSCEKEETLKNIKSDNDSYLRHFSNIKQLYSEIDKTLAMDFDQLVKYEDEIGFNSFGKLSETIYNSIAEKDTNISFKELSSKVANYSEFLTLDNVGGEFYFDTKYSSSVFRYVMNKNRMFQVDTLIYKIFKEGFVTSHYSNIKLVQDLGEEQFNEMETNDVFKVYKFIKSNTDVSLPVDNNTTNQKEKVRIQINNVETYRYSVGQKVNINGLYSEKVTGWRKFCCWFNVKRHITSDYRIYSIFADSTIFCYQYCE